MEEKSKRSEALTSARKPYTQPKLKEFGQVGALTQSGTGNMGEMVDAMGNVMGKMADMESRP
jgi:hypothetical protein